MAVHSSPFDALGVPYMIPGENGARGGLEWLQLHSSGGSDRQSSRYSRSEDVKSRTSSSAVSVGSEGEAGSSLPASSSVPDSNSDLDVPGKDSEGKMSKNTWTTSASASANVLSNSHNNDNSCLPNRELVIRCSRPFSFSVLPYSTEQLRTACNTADLLKYQRESAHAFVNIDPYLMGIGGDDTW
jgi:hypothetical protein